MKTNLITFFIVMVVIMTKAQGQGDTFNFLETSASFIAS